MVAPAIEAILAGLIVGFINRMRARLERDCPHPREDRDDSDVSTASSGTAEIPHMT